MFGNKTVYSIATAKVEGKKISVSSYAFRSANNNSALTRLVKLVNEYTAEHGIADKDVKPYTKNLSESVGVIAETEVKDGKATIHYTLNATVIYI